MVEEISKIVDSTGRAPLKFKYNYNKSTLFANYGVGKDIDDNALDKSNDSMSDFDLF